MKMWTLAAPGLAAAMMLSLAGCGDDENSANDGKYDISEDTREWDACEIFNDLEPMTDFLGIEEVGDETGGSGGPQSSPMTEGEDMASAVCFGSAVFTYFDADEDDSDEAGSIAGVISTRVAPYLETDTAEQWFESDLDKSLAAAAIANPEGESEDEITQTSVEGDWDEGEYVHYESEVENYFDVLLRDGNLVMGVKVTYLNEDQDQLDFTAEEVEDWLVNSYASEVHEAVLDHVS